MVPVVDVSERGVLVFAVGAPTHTRKSIKDFPDSNSDLGSMCKV